MESQQKVQPEGEDLTLSIWEPTQQEVQQQAENPIVPIGEPTQQDVQQQGEDLTVSILEPTQHEDQQGEDLTMSIGEPTQPEVQQQGENLTVSIGQVTSSASQFSQATTITTPMSSEESTGSSRSSWGDIRSLISIRSWRRHCSENLPLIPLIATPAGQIEYDPHVSGFFALLNVPRYCCCPCFPRRPADES